MQHTSYTATSPHDQQLMLETLGLGTVDDLFEIIPAALRQEPFDLPGGTSELRMIQHMQALAATNASGFTHFCGGGFYDHHIPAAIDQLAGRGEFYTAYTPYQAEAAQGTLQAIYEFQTAMSRLTEMEVSNASLYDGGTALLEGIMMALRITGRQHVLIDQGVNPIHRTMLRSYLRNLHITYEELPLENGLIARSRLRHNLHDNTALLIMQNPNFFGCIADLTDAVEAAHAVGALALIAVYPISLGLLKTPGAMGADIVTGEGQCLGNPLSFGGPGLGFMTTRKKHARKMPGRIVGATRDADERRGFVLTLQAREQHIRREKATSNICTNEALCALRALIFLSLLGPHGLAATARTCAARAAYAHEIMTAIDGVEPAFQQPFFNEFALRLPIPAQELARELLRENIAAGFPVHRYFPHADNLFLPAFTEKHTRREIDALAAHLQRLC